MAQEEKEHLLKEIDELETHIAELKARALGPARLAGQSEQDKLLTTRVLRDAVQQQQREFAKIQAMMSEYTLCVRCREGLTYPLFVFHPSN